MKNKKERYVGYLRVSTDRQVEGYSLENQKKEIHDYCKYKGYELSGFFADEGISGKNIEDREDFKNMMRYVENKDVDGVIIWKTSRISRNVSDFLAITKKLEILDKKLISIRDNYDSSIATSKLLGIITSLISEMEKDNIIEQVKGGMQERARQGLWNGGYVPLGYSYDENKKKLIINKDEKKIIEEIFESYIKGQGYLSISDYLNSLGYKTRTGKPFYITAVKNILKNPLYAGKIRWGYYENWEDERRKGLNDNPILVEGDHEGIITEEVYELVQKKISNNPKHNNDGKPSNYLLSGILKCPECGHAMAVQKTHDKKYNKTHYYYICGSYTNRKGCHPNSNNMNKIDKQFISILDEYTDNLSVEEVKESLNRNKSKEKTDLEKKLKFIEKSIKKEQRKKNNFLDAIGLENGSKKDLNNKINDCNREITKLEKKYKELDIELLKKGEDVDFKEAFQTLKNFKKIMKKASRSERRKVIKEFVEKVLIDKEGKITEILLKINKKLTIEYKEKNFIIICDTVHPYLFEKPDRLVLEE
jgi:site-specific DNA recombinase